MSQPAIQHKRILLTQADRKEHVESGKQHRSSSLSTELRPEHLVSELCPEFQSVLDLLDSDSQIDSSKILVRVLVYDDDRGASLAAHHDVRKHTGEHPYKTLVYTKMLNSHFLAR